MVGYPAATHLIAQQAGTLGDGYITIGHGIIEAPQIFAHRSQQGQESLSASKE